VFFADTGAIPASGIVTVREYGSSSLLGLAWSRRKPPPSYSTSPDFAPRSYGPHSVAHWLKQAVVQMQLPRLLYSVMADWVAAAPQLFEQVMSVGAQALRQLTRSTHDWSFMHAVTSVKHLPPAACAVVAQVMHVAVLPESVGGGGPPLSTGPVPESVGPLEQSAAHGLAQVVQMQLPTLLYSVTACMLAAVPQLFWHVVSVALQALRQLTRVAHEGSFVHAVAALEHWPPVFCAVFAQVVHDPPAAESCWPPPLSLAPVPESLPPGGVVPVPVGFGVVVGVGPASPEPMPEAHAEIAADSLEQLPLLIDTAPPGHV
jgi:hypothetical protein